jgi:acyl-CoA synthetase (AMP-forming)/AMP-acid ligase II
MIIRLFAGAAIIGAVLYSSAEADTSTDIVVESATCQCDNCLTESDVRAIAKDEIAKAAPKAETKPAAVTTPAKPASSDKVIVQIGGKYYEATRGANGTVCIGGRCYPRGSYAEMVQ